MLYLLPRCTLNKIAFDCTEQKIDPMAFTGWSSFPHTHAHCGRLALFSAHVLQEAPGSADLPSRLQEHRGVAALWLMHELSGVSGFFVLSLLDIIHFLRLCCVQGAKYRTSEEGEPITEPPGSGPLLAVGRSSPLPRTSA